MSSLDVPNIVSNIRSPPSIKDQILALKALRNDIIGNQQRKDVWAASGVLEGVVEAATREATSSVGSQSIEDNAFILTASLTNTENIRLQALAVLGGFASGGPKFVRMLLDAFALQAILSNIRPAVTSSPLVLSALRVLVALARSSLLSIESCPTNLSTIAEAVFSDDTLGSLCKILRQSPKNADVDAQISYTASLIGSLCCHDRYRDSLVSAGVLDALANVLAVVVVSQGLAIPGPGLNDHIEELRRHSSVAHPEKIDVGGVLNALATIIADSKSRAYSLVRSPALRGIWHHSPSIASRSSSSHQSARICNAIDCLNPELPCTKPCFGSASSAFPPLGSQDLFNSEFRSDHNQRVSLGANRHEKPEMSSDCSTPKSPQDSESPLISYLIWITRSSDSIVGVRSARLLATIYKAGVAGQQRDVDIALLIVPLLVLWLDEAFCSCPSSCERIRSKFEVISTLVPAVLAKFVLDSERLQKAAYDAGAVPKLCKILKSSYQPVQPQLIGHSWCPQSSNRGNTVDRSANHEQNLPPLLVHKIKVRECALKAIAALLPFKDDYRKALVAEGAMPSIVESLKPRPGQHQEVNGGERQESAHRIGSPSCKITPVLGINTAPILVAACAIVQHLARSPAILRTTLVDSGVSLPIFELLHHSDVEVQIAATAAVCNLVTDMSPMRLTILEAGVQKILCQHAHSKNLSMQYNALWALKHFIQAADTDTKKSCLRDLGQNWLLDLIRGDSEDNVCPSNGLDNLNIDRDYDIAMESSDDEDEERPGFYSPSPRTISDKYDDGNGQSWRRASTQVQNFDSVPQGIRRVAKDTKKDETRIQEQGIDILRNFLGGPTSSPNSSGNEQMVAYLFDSIGENELFELLASKLRAKVLHPFAHDYSGVNHGDTKVLPPRPEILAAVFMLLVNIAASNNPRHRHAIIQQTELMRLVMQHYDHHVKEVRQAFCWLIIDLTYAENELDRSGSIDRVKELHRLGVTAKVDQLLKDADLDVRERAKTAKHQLCYA